MVTLLTLQQQRQSWETYVQIYCQYMCKGNCVSRQCDFIIRFDLDLSVFANSNSEESKWMAAGICFLLPLYGEGG